MNCNLETYYDLHFSQASQLAEKNWLKLFPSHLGLDSGILGKKTPMPDAEAKEDEGRKICYFVMFQKCIGFSTEV